MFELEIEREKKRCMDIMVERGDYTTLQRLCAIEGIPMFYKTFFAAHADWWIYELNQERASDRRFDYSDNSVVSLLQETDKVLRETVRFSAEEFLGLLDTAVKARLNFLCRPRTTLRWFVFRGEPTKTIHEVWLRLNYFYDYQYLTNGFREWAEKTYSDHPSPELLTISDFENLIMEIDNAMILELTPYQFTDLLAPLYDFFAPSGQAADDYALPIEALIIFLDDKGVDLIAKELERMYYEEHTDKINREEFLNVVTTILSSLDDGEPQPIAEETEQPQSIEEVTEEDNFVLSPEFDEANSGFLGLIHSYSQTRDYVSVDKEESVALYMAEFMRDDSFVQDNIDAMREKPQLLKSDVLHNHDEESPTDDSEETIEQVMDEEIQSLQENEEEFVQMPSIEELVFDNSAEDTYDGMVEEIHLPDSLNLDKEESTETTQNEQQDTEIVDIAVNDIIAETVENAEQQTTTDAFHSDATEATETASILPEDEEAVNSDERDS
jgi:hypothetical protein